MIWTTRTEYGSFEDEVNFFASQYLKDERIGPVIGVYCAKCEFKITVVNISPSMKSGFHECWNLARFTNEQLRTPLVLELWNSRKKAEFLLNKKFI